MDRDGTINKDVGYPDSFDLVEIYPFSFEAVRKINRAGFLAVIITNQSGVGRGLIQEKKLKNIHNKLKAAFFLKNARIDGIYYCPHYKLSKIADYRINCLCRKPNPGLAQKAARDLNIDLSNSFMIGDKVEDILFGINIGAKPILVLTGYGKQSLPVLNEKGIKPSWIASNLLAGVNWILKDENKKIPTK